MHAIPVENSVRAGVPDVNFAGGWIECKRLARWPTKSDERIIRFSHPLSIQQARFLKTRWSLGELALLCVHVERQWFFIDGDVAGEVFGKVTRKEMIERSSLYMKTFNEKELVTWISSRL